MARYPQLTYEEFKHKQEEEAEELSYQYRHDLRKQLPQEAKEILDDEIGTFSELENLAEKYLLSDDKSSDITGFAYDIVYGLISIGDLPTFIEKEVEVDRYVALQCAIKLSRRIFSKCAEYLDYIESEDIEFYIKKWKDELPDELYKLRKTRG